MRSFLSRRSGFLFAFPAGEQHLQKSDLRRGHAVDARRLRERGRTDAREFEAGLVFEAGESRIIDVGGDRPSFKSVQMPDGVLLLPQIPLVMRLHSELADGAAVGAVVQVKTDQFRLERERVQI